ncbi:interleukin-6 receptor subunit beta-like isoform X2 [Trematomus bernacchii]|uniref:interleukin-6 receptor subunit beta-like isoform X2 n=1 Tax=Trematomus bernacchii TaxID=40690 RepID=UPI00146BBFC3|nr:interleukin-6 receptor subunit beta-like isoform X2 [Trematomus bernacchii]
MGSHMLKNEPLRLFFRLYHMESLKSWSLLHEYIILLILFTTVSKACDAPSSPECFRRTAEAPDYRCEWSMKNTTESNVKFDLYIDEVRVRNIARTWFEINEKPFKRLKNRSVKIWVEAHIGNSRCASTNTSVVLSHTVKYEAPKHISMSWLKNNLSLSWTASEKHPAAAEILLRRDAHRTDSWGKITTNTTSDTSMHHVLVENLLKDTAYQVKIRHRSTKALNPLWSDWSPVVTVPAELEQIPEVTMNITLSNGTRKVVLTWKKMPHAEMYSLNETQSSNGCNCKKIRDYRINTTETNYTTFVSYSAVKIFVNGRNAAGSSPPAILQIPAVPAAELKICDNTLLNIKPKKKTCPKWFELQDADLGLRSVSDTDIKDYVRYLYFEHKCIDGKPWTHKMCLFYQKEGAPLREPQDFIAFSETHNSTNLSWKAIPSTDQRGFLTHYSLCSVKVSSQDERKECHNISASVMKYRLGNLTQETTYRVSLVGVTRVGEGPEATVTINTLPEKPVNVLWKLCLLFLFVILTTMCTCILKRIKDNIFPAVPTPVIPDFIPYQPESQGFMERKEEVDELTLLQLHPEVKSVPEDAEESAVLAGEWEEDTDEDEDNERWDSRMLGGSSDECLSPGSTEEALRSSREGEMTDVEQLDNEIAMLIYKKGLVFDVKTDSL